MTRQEALRTLWMRLFGLLLVVLSLCSGLLLLNGVPRVGVLVFLIGNIGGYVGVHRSLGELNDAEVVGLASSWWSLVAPSFVGGILALVLYVLFLTGILGAGLFPTFVAETSASKGVEVILNQHGEGMRDYAKLFFWSFVAGFNQKYVVDIISSVKGR